MAIRLATFNLKDFFTARREEERAPVEAKVAMLAASLRRANADIVALQEVGAPELLDRVVTKEVPELGYGAPILGSEDRRGIRNAILSRLPVLWSQVHQPKTLAFPPFAVDDPEPFPGRIRLRRGVVHVRVEAGSSLEIDVLTAHFKSGLPSMLKTPGGESLPDSTVHGLAESAVRSHVQRTAEALYVRSLVDGIFAQSPDHAICVMGDLNDVPESLPVRIVRGFEVPGVGGRRHCLRAGAELLAVERRFSCLHGDSQTLIDHILVSERLHQMLRCFEIHNESLRFHGPHIDDAPLTPDSDHALCLAEFEVSDPP
jgi:endonuclease/exonuclease/phosphatase family metal-dependent hydrolase